MDCPGDRLFAHFGAWLGSAEQRKAQNEENLGAGKQSAFKQVRAEQLLNPKT
jgi:hypothetical protein